MKELAMIQRHIRSLKIDTANRKRPLEIDESSDEISGRDETLPGSGLASSSEQSDSGPSAPKCPRIDETSEISDDSD